MSTWTYSASSSAFLSGAGVRPGIAFGAGKFVIATGNATGISSSDGGVTWASIPGYPASFFNFIAFGNGIFLTGLTWSGTVVSYATSPDGVTWTNRTFDANVVLGTIINTFHEAYNIKFLNGAFYIFLNTDIGGDTFELVTSTDGINWTDALAGGHLNSYGANQIDMAFGAGVYAVQAAGSIWSGSTTAALVEQPGVFPDNFTNVAGIVFGNGKFLTICDDGNLLFTSPDGNTWTSGFVPPDVSLHQATPESVGFMSGKFYLGGFDSAFNSRFFSSSDASAWTEEFIPNPPGAGAGTWLPGSFDGGSGAILVAGSQSNFGVDGAIVYATSGTAVPNVVGDTLPTATGVLTTDGFTVGTVTIEDSDTVPAGIVAAQTPVGGTIEPAGTPVNLVVSTGPVSLISKLTQKLLLYLHRIFDKDPHPILAFRVQYNGTGLTWSILNGVLTLTATGGTGTSYTFNIANFAIGQLAQFIAALPGYSVPYQDTSAYALLSALALLDQNGNINVSNGDHVFGYTTLLWAWMDSNSSELGTAKGQITNALAQMSTTTAQDEWLDYHGSFYKVPRLQGELDPAYSPRMIASVLQPRGNNIAIAEAIKSITQAGEPVFVIDAINDTGFAITYNGLIHYDGSEFYDAGLGPDGAYGFFDVDFSFDFSGSVSQSTYFDQILATVADFRDAGTQLRAIIFRNNGSTVTIVSDSFVDGIRVIVYDDFTGASFRLLENGLVRFTEAGDARILES